MNGGGSMIKAVYFIVAIVFIVMLGIVGCSTGIQTIPPAITDNQTNMPQVSVTGDNKSNQTQPSGVDSSTSTAVQYTGVTPTMSVIPPNTRYRYNNDEYGFSLTHPFAWSAIAFSEPLIYTACAQSGEPSLSIAILDKDKFRESFVDIMTGLGGKNFIWEDYPGYVHLNDGKTVGICYLLKWDCTKVYMHSQVNALRPTKTLILSVDINTNKTLAVWCTQSGEAYNENTFKEILTTLAFKNPSSQPLPTVAPIVSIKAWAYMPNENVNWKINAFYYFANSWGGEVSSKSCQQTGYIDNLHKELFMTEVTINDVIITDWIEPGGRFIYAKDVSCKNAQLKWIWKPEK
jgi:hypothetical protein